MTTPRAARLRLAARWDERPLVREAVTPPFLPSSLRATAWSQQIDFDTDPDFDADGHEAPETNNPSRKKTTQGLSTLWRHVTVVGLLFSNL